jgi:hypothetical protein
VRRVPSVVFGLARRCERSVSVPDVHRIGRREPSVAVGGVDGLPDGETWLISGENASPSGRPGPRLRPFLTCSAHPSGHGSSDPLRRPPPVEEPALRSAPLDPPAQVLAGADRHVPRAQALPPWLLLPEQPSDHGLRRAWRFHKGLGRPIVRTYSTVQVRSPVVHT